MEEGGVVGRVVLVEVESSRVEFVFLSVCLHAVEVGNAVEVSEGGDVAGEVVINMELSFDACLGLEELKIREVFSWILRGLAIDWQGLHVLSRLPFAIAGQ